LTDSLNEGLDPLEQGVQFIKEIGFEQAEESPGVPGHNPPGNLSKLLSVPQNEFQFL